MTINATNPPPRVVLGRVGENEYRAISFDVSKWRADYPDGTISIILERPDGELYPIIVNATTSPISYTPNQTDLAIAGRGRLELRITSGSTVGKSAIIDTIVYDALGEADDPPVAPAPDWTETVAENAAAANESAAGAAESAAAAAESAERGAMAVNHYPYIDDNKHWIVWNGVAWVDTGVIAEGVQNITADNVNAAYSGATDTQKATARENIGAVSGAEVSAAVTPKADKQDTANALHKTLSGTAVRADDVSPLAHKLGIVQYGQCVQDGTPTPAAPVAITGKAAGGKVYAGKNLLDPTTIESGWIVPSTGNTANGAEFMRSGYIEVSPNTTYTQSESPTTTGAGYAWYDEDKIYISGGAYSGSIPLKSMTSPQNAKYIRLTVTSNYTPLGENQFELGSTATAYEPYQAPITQTVTDSNGDPVTLYGIPVASGGNVTIGTQQYVADTLEGTTVTRRVIGVDLGAVTRWYYKSDSAYFYAELSSQPKTDTNGFFAQLNSIGYVCGNSAAVNMTMQYYGGYIRIKNTAYSTTADFTTAMSGVMLYYELATPTTETVTLSTATLDANSPTTTWLSEAHSEVTYNRDSNAVQNSNEARLATIEAHLATL